MAERLEVPAEWERHEACWLAFPYLKEQWPVHLRDAQHSIAALCRAIAEDGNEPVHLLVKDQSVAERAQGLIGESPNIDYVLADYGDCWVRDTAPLLGRTSAGALGGLCFRFNGWGGKFEIPFDDELGDQFSKLLDLKRFESEVVLEGGALEFDGQGTFITTASCVLNPNRNPGLTRTDFEDVLSALVSVDQLIWLDRGLSHDHTDGHVDMITRFVAPQTVLCIRPNRGDPNADAMRAAQKALRESALTVLTLPAPGPVYGPDGLPLPATYCNFYIANEAVIVPTYDVPEDREALRTIASSFPNRQVIGLPGRDLLWGGGAFHCVTQPQPATP